MRNLSPLRYPGGKSSLSRSIAELISDKCPDCYHYVEPYAGGAGVALHLLSAKHVKRIWINDFDPKIYAFWSSVLTDTESFIAKINDTDVSVDQWRLQREVLKSSDVSELDLGFAAFFLNRTSRSGIILRSGVIGGYKQSGTYKIDCRFNKAVLIERIKTIASMSDSIRLTCRNGISVVREAARYKKPTFIYLDPPYFDMGSRLYENYFLEKDHRALSRAIKDSPHPWLVTYDDVDDIRLLYDDCSLTTQSLVYSLHRKRSASELVIQP